MKTSVNVMGIQAKGMLERIGVTLKAVMRAGGEQRTAIVVEGQRTETKAELHLFTACDPVFYEDRLLTEIPEPNWQEGLIVHPRVLVDSGGMGQGIQAPTANGSAKQIKSIRRSFRDGIRKQHSHMTASPVESKPAKEQRDVKSSLSPPLRTLT